jgi:hypothetical protein
VGSGLMLTHALIKVGGAADVEGAVGAAEHIGPGGHPGVCVLRDAARERRSSA